CYGLAEATLIVSGTRTAPAAAGRAVDAAALESGLLTDPVGPGRTVTHCGPPASVDVRIVDPDTCAEVADGVIGEIWVRGESGGPCDGSSCAANSPRCTSGWNPRSNSSWRRGGGDDDGRGPDRCPGAGVRLPRRPRQPARRRRAARRRRGRRGAARGRTGPR